MRMKVLPVFLFLSLTFFYKAEGKLWVVETTDGAIPTQVEKNYATDENILEFGDDYSQR